MHVRACVDQLRVKTEMRARSADAAFQNMRYPQIISDLSHISFLAIFHHTAPTDHFQIGDPRQLGQNVILDAVDEGSGVFSLLAEIFKRQNRDSSCYRMTDKFAFPNDPASGCRQSDETSCKQRAARIAPHPLSAAAYDSSVSR